MKIGPVHIDDTFAEAFGMRAVRLLITADTLDWARTAATAMTGFATSVIACGCEAGIEKVADETPDSRPGIWVLIFAMSSKELIKQTVNRSGQCIMTSPTSALFAENGAVENAFNLGGTLRYFGDGYQIAKVFNDVRYWRIPVMDGEFLCQDQAFYRKAIGGGNFLILAKSRAAALAAAERAVVAMDGSGDIIMPFPGGVVRSGSKVGSRYRALMASTNQRFCPTLKGRVRDSYLDDSVACVMEIVINGLDEQAISQAMEVGIRAVCEGEDADQIVRISAGNYGGKLGPHHFHLRKILV